MSSRAPIDRPSILVLDGEQRAALAVVRSLGRRGLRVHVASSLPRPLAGASRFALTEALLPDPLADTVKYAREVADMAARRDVQVVLPVSEPATLALLEHSELLRQFRLPTSDLLHFRQASDKASVLALAETIGIATPPQWMLQGPEDNIGAIPEQRYPVVVKPARSIAGPEGRRRKVGVAYADNPDELRTRLRELGSDAGPVLVQARVEGAGLGIFLLRWEGEFLASFAHRRIREKPPSGGVSVCSESVAPPADLVTRSQRLLERLDWNGVAMVEYKQDRRSGEPYLMEINPRFWGSLQLAIDAGVDFPWYLVRAALGHPEPPVHSWKVGVRCRWAWGDMDHLLTRLRHSDATLAIPADAPGRLATMVQVLFPWRPRQRGEVFRLSDPAPGIRETLAWLRAL